MEEENQNIQQRLPQESPAVAQTETHAEPQAPASDVPMAMAPAETYLAPAETGHAEPGAHLTSKKRWFYAGLTIALLNPIFCGIIFGVFLWNEPELKKEGKIITMVAVIWGAIILTVFSWLVSAGKVAGFSSK
jgi:hypothetical protein